MTPVPKPLDRRGLFQILAPFWLSEQRWKALLLLLATLSVIFFGIYVQVWGNQLLGDVTDALVQREWGALKPVLLLSVAVGVMSGLATLSREALQGMLELSWRSWLTERLLRDWTESHVFYHLEREGALSNADQRIAEDVRLFITATLNLSLNALGVIASAATFTAVLWQLSGTLRFDFAGYAFAIPGYLVYLAYATAIGSFALAHWVGKAMVGLDIHRQTVEADFRHGAMQLRENAEQIAFYGGGARESKRLMKRFEKIRRNVIAMIIRTLKVALTTQTYVHLFAPVPTLAALPRYLAGEITIGAITRIAGAFSALATSLAFFTNSYKEFTNWYALACRLHDLQTSLREARERVSGFAVERVEQDFLSTETLQLCRPDGVVLAEVPPLHFARGERWLVRGTSGTGKSTLLRALGGLWPHGSGRIMLPAAATLMFLPQRSYIPNGSFKAAMCYPADKLRFSDSLCRRVLMQCGLAAYAHRLDSSEHWQQKLSGGEQQRLAFARVLLHQPDFVFLDEATSALDPDTERMLYQSLIEHLPGSGVISVAHRTSLDEYHSKTLELVPSKGAQEPAKGLDDAAVSAAS